MASPRGILTKEHLQWAAFWAGLVCVLLIPHGMNGDGWQRFIALRAFIRTGHLDGMAFSWVGPLFAIPLEFFSPDKNLPDYEAVDHSYVLYFNFIVLCAGLGLLWKLLSSVLSKTEHRVFLILLVFASLMPHSTVDFFGETFSALTLGGGMILLARNRYLEATPLLALGVGNTPALGFPLTLVILVHCWERRRIAPIAILAAAAAVVLVDRWIDVRSFQNRWQFMFSLAGANGNDHGIKTWLPFSGLSGFSYPLLPGVFSILFSFGKGLLWFLPGLWIPFWWRPQRTPEKARIVRYWLIFTVGMVLIYCKWWAWYGGFWWGPRYFYFCSLPASLLLAELISSLKDRPTVARFGFAILLLVAAFWVCASSLLYDTGIANGYNVCFDNSFAQEFACWYIPEFSPLFRPLVLPQALNQDYIFIVPVWLFSFASLALSMILDFSRFYERVGVEDKALLPEG